MSAPPEESFGPWEVGLLALYPIQLAALVTIDALRGWLVALFGGLPVVGGPIRSAVDSALGGLHDWLWAQQQQNLGAYNRLLDQLWATWYAVEQGVGGWVDGLDAALYRLRDLNLPAAVAAAQAYLEGLVGEARAYAGGLFGLAERDAEAAFRLAESDLGRGLAVAEGDLVRAAQTAEADLTAGLGAVRAEAQDLFRQAEQEIAQAEARAASEARRLIALEHGFAQLTLETIARDLGAIEAQVGAQIPELIGTVSRDVAALRAQTQAQIPELTRNVTAEVKAITESPQWALLSHLLESGEALGKTGIVDLIGLSARATRSELGQVEALRARFEPAIAQARKAFMEALAQK